MRVPPILSRPVYGTLLPRPGPAHIFVADVAGVAAVVDMAARCPPDFFADATLILVVPAQFPAEDGLRSLRPRVLEAYPAVEAALHRLVQILARSTMGSQLYTAGGEGLIGQVIRTGVAAGLERAAIVTEHRGSAARRVQCVHCKSIMDGVKTQPVQCNFCGLHLMVRDHYSHRIAAFQGVCIDAEHPGSAPSPEDVFA